ncbi:unnamed protein product [Staurois parvus]|uniref:Uncharacterized protein n=1 Tax=Staurois parvus TaxID=386267 RepID=A0ABN9B611_9NEOB|nr:unnamed protein product [Staurois parvus]
MGEVQVLQKFVGCQSGFASTFGRILGSTGLCANSWWLRDNTCARHRTGLYCTYGTRHATKSYCIAGMCIDQDVLDRWCSPVHQKVAWH